MPALEKFTSADLALMPEDGNRYEIIEGELFVSGQPTWEHQYTISRFIQFMSNWKDQSQSGSVVATPGLVFADDDDVVPDVVWISNERLATALDASRHLVVAPELVIEVPSPGAASERRDKDIKLRLYSRHGVHEYWIADVWRYQIEVYRRENAALKHAATLYAEDTIDSPLLQGFSCHIADLFFLLPSQKTP